MRRILLPLLLALPLLAGCGADRAAQLKAAAERTLAGPARVQVDARVHVAGRDVRIRGRGVLDGPRRLLRATYTVDAAGSSQRGEAVLDVRRFVLYLRQASLARDLAGRRRWVRIDVGRALHAEGIDLGLLGGTETDSAGRLRRVHTTLTYAGARVSLDVAITPLASPVEVALPPAAEVASAALVADAKRARAGVRAAAVALESYRVAKGGYLGATAGRLRRYDATLDPALRVVVASQDLYCVEVMVGRATAHLGGPGGRARSGPC